MEKVGIGSRIEHKSFGLGVVVEVDGDIFTIYFNESGDVKEINREFEGLSLHHKVALDIVPIDISDIENAVERAFRKVPKNDIPIVEMGERWLGGTVTLTPGLDGLQSKDVPMDTFFNKIIMIRERLRVLEQNINNHEKLNETEKIHLQQYITRSYGSLTTFNILFADKQDHFKGFGKS